ncbi:TetR/AcrR family transcriptional regulator [Nocardioides sp. zg-1230]|nr:TetR/AcrR family transcriptional regulator [Nocardioides sp. zg-1230]
MPFVCPPTASICTECNNGRVTTTPPTDGRSALREERRRAILDAARALATEHGADGFTVEQVAARAGVSRRTVFNHVAGLDQLLVAVCEQILAEVTTDLLADIERRTTGLNADDAGCRSALDAVAEATRGVDLPTAIATIHRVLGSPAVHDERAQGIARAAFDHVGGRLRAQMQRRAPALDPVDLELSLALLFAGITTIADLWLADHPDLAPDVPPAARADWDDLLDRLLHRIRVGVTG